MGVAQLPNLFYASPASGSGLFDYRAIAYSDVSGLNLGTVTEVALSAPNIFSVAGSPVTGDGTLTLSLVSQGASYVLAAPTGVSGTPTFRPLTTADISGYSASTGVGGSGTMTYLGLTAPSIFSVSGSPVTGSGTIDFSVVNQSARTFWAAPTGAIGTPSFRTITAVDISGLATSATGTVTYVGLTAPATFLVNPNAVSGSGTLGLSYVNQSANQIFSGPASGSSTAPTFRSLVPADVSGAAVTNVSLALPNIFSVSSAVTGVGTLTGTLVSQNSGTFFAAPAASNSAPSFRAITGTDIAPYTGTVTSIALQLPSFITVGGSPITTNGTLTGTLANQSANLVFASPTGSANVPTFRSLVARDIAPYSGTVYSVGLSLPSIITVSNSPVTGNGTLTGTLANQNANTIWAGAASGSATTPTFRALVPADVSGAAVTNVGLSLPNIFTVSNSPVTGVGTLTATLANQTQALFLASPTGSTGAPTFRSIVYTDISGVIPVTAATGTVTSVSLTAPSFLSVGGSPITGSGTLALTLASQTSGTFLAAPAATNGTPSFRAIAVTDMAPYTGTVSSVALSLPSFITVGGSPVTGNGTLTGTLATQTANTSFVGPASGSAAAPTFRALVPADVSGAAVTNVGLALPNIFTVSNSPVTGVGTLTGSLVNQSANLVWAGAASGGASTPAFRALVPADVSGAAVTNIGLSMPSIFSVSNTPVTGVGTISVSLANANANTFLSGPSTGAATTPTFRAIASGDVSSFAELLANKNQPNGYAGLDSNGQLVGIFIGRNSTASSMNTVVLSSGELATTTDTYELRLGNNSASGGIPLSINSPNTIYLPGAFTSGINGSNLLAAYSRLIALTPYGSAISSTNPAILQLGPGFFDIRDAGPINLNNSGVVIIGAGKGITTIYSDATTAGMINLNSNYVTLQNMTLLPTPGTNNAVMNYNAGVGTGVYSPSNDNVKFTDLEILQLNASSASPNINMNTGIAILAGTYSRCNTNHFFLSPTSVQAWTVSATFEDCVAGGGANSRCWGGGVGGFATFNGTLRRCRNISSCTINLLVSGGLVENCSFRSGVSNGDMFRAAPSVTNSRFHYNRLTTNGTGKPIGDGTLSGLVVQATHNYWKNAPGTGVNNSAASGTLAGLSGCNIADPLFTTL